MAGDQTFANAGRALPYSVPTPTSPTIDPEYSYTILQ